ncbi:MAG: hypothetical protein B7X83_09870 [Polynucleobacter sp. 17-46-58]|nr:MAG: hypothetical protein B7X83_09870 [Polynucleobacter sp. 17-46-58]
MWFAVVRTQVDVVLPTGVCVLNADDPIIVKMAELSKGEVLYFSKDPHSKIIAEHQAKNGRSITVSAGFITLQQGDSEKLAIPIPPSIKQANSSWAPDLSLAAAVGAAWGLDIPFNVIEAGVETFVSDTSIPPGV